MLPLLISVLLTVLSYHLYSRLRFKLPPGPRPWPVVGNFFGIKPVHFRCYHEWAKVYGPIISVWFGSTLNVIVSNSELAREVLRDHDQHLTDRQRDQSTDLLSVNGSDLIWADYGPQFVKAKKVCNLGLFSAKRLELLRPVREDEVTAMIHFIYKDYTSLELKKGKSLMLRKYLGAVAFNIIARITFGKRAMNEEGSLNELGLELMAIGSNIPKIRKRSSMVAEHVPWLWWAFPLKKEAFVKHNERWYRLAKAIMLERSVARCKTGCTQEHLVDTLLTLKDEYDLSEDTVIGLLSDMTVAGIDTMAISVERAMAEMIRNPQAQQKAQEELDRVIGPDRILTELDFPNLPYLQALAKESLRLHPPTPLMLPHRAKARVKVGGYDIPKGTVVHVNVWALARDPAVWKDPLEFRPERFLEEDIDIKGSDFRVLPFGAGRRVCPGAQLGMNLVTSILGHLLHHFTWSLPNGLKPEEIDMSENPGLVTYMTYPLQVVPCPRLPSHLYTRVACA